MVDQTIIKTSTIKSVPNKQLAQDDYMLYEHVI